MRDARKTGGQCVECTAETANRALVCDACAPEYEEAPFVDDVCPCPSCRSDLTKLVPCRREAE